MAPHSTAACGISALSRCERHSGRPGRTRSRRDGSSRCEPSVSTICWSSTRLICVEPYQRMSCISIIGVRIDHLVNARPASPLCVSFGLEGPTPCAPTNDFNHLSPAAWPHLERFDRFPLCFPIFVRHRFPSPRRRCRGFSRLIEFAAARSTHNQHAASRSSPVRLATL